MVRRAAAGEQLTTLDGVDRTLDAEDMVICDAVAQPGRGRGRRLPISLAAVMGGETSEVAPDTTDVLFEAAHWDPVDGRAAPPAGTSCSARPRSAGSAASTRRCRWSRWSGR